MGRWWHNETFSSPVRREWHGEIDILAFAEQQQHHTGFAVETEEASDPGEPFA